MVDDRGRRRRRPTTALDQRRAIALRIKIEAIAVRFRQLEREVAEYMDWPEAAVLFLDPEEEKTMGLRGSQFFAREAERVERERLERS